MSSEAELARKKIEIIQAIVAEIEITRSMWERALREAEQQLATGTKQRTLSNSR